MDVNSSGTQSSLFAAKTFERYVDYPKQYGYAADPHVHRGTAEEKRIKREEINKLSDHKFFNNKL